MFLALGALGLLVSTTPLEIREGYPILHDVLVNGKGPYRMLVDTGAQTTSVSPGIAAEVGLRPTFAVELHNPLGVSVAPGAKADRLSSGELELEGVEVLITEPPRGGALGRLDGVIGQSFLARTNYWMDYAGRRMLWDPDARLAACMEGERLGFVNVDGRPAVTVRFPSEGRSERRLVLDSGASHLILFGWPAKPGEAATGRMRTAQKEEKVRVVGVGTMATAGMKWRGLTAGVVDAPGAGVDGLLPAHLLKSFYINNRKQYALVAPRVSERCASGPTGPLARRAEEAGRKW